MKKLISICCVLLPSLVYAQTWTDIEILNAGDKKYGDQFGQSVHINGDLAVVGAPFFYNPDGGDFGYSEQGAVYVFRKDSAGNWNEEQKILASDGKALDRFGYSVCINDDYLIASVRYNRFSPQQYSDAKVYVFQRDSSGAFIEKQILREKSKRWRNRFGYQVKLLGSDIYINVTNYDNDQGIYMTNGAICHFKIGQSGLWEQVQTITIDTVKSGLFGTSFDVDSNFLIVGNPYFDLMDSLQSVGQVFVFTRPTDKWKESQVLYASNGTTFDNFGLSIGLRNNWLVIGAPNKGAQLFSDQGAGAAYIFSYTNGIWEEEQMIQSSQIEAGDYFGESIDIGEEYVIVGSRFTDLLDSLGGLLSNAGAAFIFKPDQTNKWVQFQKITSSDSVHGGWFGYQVSIDDKYSIIGFPGAHHDPKLNTPGAEGQAHIYALCSETHSTLIVNACKSFHSISRKHLWTKSGTYVDTINNAIGCDSIITINLNIYPSNTSTEIIQEDNFLISGETEADYQWFRCDSNFSRIDSAKNRMYGPSSFNRFAVEIRKNGCIDTSFCYRYVQEPYNLDLGVPLILFPNPNDGKFQIQVGRQFPNMNIRITNSIGQVLYHGSVNSEQLLSISIDQVAGVYFVYFESQSEIRAVQKFIIKR
ncbi:MAG: T9SS type A sorting domain-containing protein [Bacteroidia bacterium]